MGATLVHPFPQTVGTTSPFSRNNTSFRALERNTHEDNHHGYHLEKKQPKKTQHDGETDTNTAQYSGTRRPTTRSLPPRRRFRAISFVFFFLFLPSNHLHGCNEPHPDHGHLTGRSTRTKASENRKSTPLSPWRPRREDKSRERGGGTTGAGNINSKQKKDLLYVDVHGLNFHF